MMSENSNLQRRLKDAMEGRVSCRQQEELLAEVGELERQLAVSEESYNKLFDRYLYTNTFKDKDTQLPESGE